MVPTGFGAYVFGMKTPIKVYMVTLLAAAGLVVGCNQSVESNSQSFNSLPTAVQKTVRSQSPNGEITGISKTSENGMDAFKVSIRNPGNNNDSTLIVANDGRVISSDMPTKPNGLVSDVKKALTPTGAVGTKFSALPEAVQKTIQAHAPESQIADVSRHSDNGRVIYEVSFQDQGKNPSIKVAEDGTLVQDLQK
jgi:uncharacterized membrane protein YkoI